MNKKYSIILIISIVVIVAAYSLMGGGGRTDLDIGEDRLSVSYKDFSFTVDYKYVTTIELVEVSDFGEPLGGGSDKACRWGTWENEVWGEYNQYTIAGTSNAVLLRLHDGGVFLLSYESGETTEMLSELLYEMLSTHGYKAEYINSLP